MLSIFLFGIVIQSTQQEAQYRLTYNGNVLYVNLLLTRGLPKSLDCLVLESEDECLGKPHQVLCGLLGLTGQESFEHQPDRLVVWPVFTGV